MENNPLVTVNILSFNRKDELRITLTKVFEQDYNNIEVIVVDNASTDGSPEMVEKEFPNVILIKLNKNIGIAGWNEGFKIAKGEYVLVLDDDAYPKNNSIELALNKLENNELAACVAFNIFDLNSKTYYWSTTWLPSYKIRGDIYCPMFVGCAAMFSQNKLNFIEPMPKNYFLYQHELPVGADISIKGYKIIFNAEIIAYHRCKLENEYNEKNDKLILKNNLLFIKNYIPAALYVFYKLQICIFYFTRSIRRKWFKAYIKLIHSSRGVKKNDKTISYKYFFELRKLHLFNLSIFSKIKNFYK